MAVEVVLTRKIERAIFKVKQLDGISRNFLDRLSQYNEDEDKDEDTKEVENEKTIEFAVVREVWQHLKKSNAISDKNGPIYLHELLEGSDLYVEPPKQREKNPELVARLKKLKAQQERLQYDRMVSNIGPKWDDATKDLATEVKSTSKQLSSIVNFLCSVVATFVFGFVASQYAFPSLSIRVIIGLVLACLVAAAELYFMARTEI